ncbi:MAG: NAD(P)H-dependent oxidoreductase [Actinomycetota bacterium]
MRLLAIPATNSPAGLNRQLVDHAVRRVGGTLAADSGLAVDAEIVDLNDYEMPIYSQAREAAGGVPQPAHQLYEKIGSADALIVSFAEHNGSYSSAWKNVYDWMSRINSAVYQGTPVVMLAATPGPRGGAGVLGSATVTAPFFGAELVGSLGVPTFFDNFDSDAGTLTDPDLQSQLDEVLASLLTAAAASAG